MFLAGWRPGGRCLGPRGTVASRQLTPSTQAGAGWKRLSWNGGGLSSSPCPQPLPAHCLCLGPCPQHPPNPPHWPNLSQLPFPKTPTSYFLYFFLNVQFFPPTSYLECGHPGPLVLRSCLDSSPLLLSLSQLPSPGPCRLSYEVDTGKRDDHSPHTRGRCPPPQPSPPLLTGVGMGFPHCLDRAVPCSDGR